MILVIAGTLVLSQCNAQFIKKTEIPTYSCMFAAGACYGIGESIIWHPTSTKPFWNPYIENGVNKWDAYHLSRGAERAFLLGAVILSINDFKKPKFFPIAKKVILCSLTWQAGMTLTYSIIKP